MYTQLRLFIISPIKMWRKCPNIHSKSLQQKSNTITVRFHESSFGNIAVRKIRESNLAYAGSFADCKPIQSDLNKFSRQVKLLRTNLRFLPSSRCNKSMNNIDTNWYYHSADPLSGISLQNYMYFIIVIKKKVLLYFKSNISFILFNIVWYWHY